jgi:hypothetical protein
MGVAQGYPDEALWYALRIRRGVAQMVSAPVWGTGGRRFESCLPDHTDRVSSPAEVPPSRLERRPAHMGQVPQAAQESGREA